MLSEARAPSRSEDSDGVIVADVGTGAAAGTGLIDGGESADAVDGALAAATARAQAALAPTRIARSRCDLPRAIAGLIAIPTSCAAGREPYTYRSRWCRRGS